MTPSYSTSHRPPTATLVHMHIVRFSFVCLLLFVIVLSVIQAAIVGLLNCYPATGRKDINKLIGVHTRHSGRRDTVVESLGDCL